MDKQQPAAKRSPAPFRVRPQSRETRFVKLRSLKCFAEVHQRVLDGWPMPELARYIQDEKREYTDVTKDGLVAVLKEYRASIPPGQLIQKRMPQVFHKAAAEVAEGVDELKEMEKLYRLQMERIGIDVNTEKKINKLMPTVTQEIRVAREILSGMASLKMDLGIDKRHIGQVDIDAKVQADITNKYGSQAVVAVLQNPESRRKVLGVVDRVLKLAGKREGDEGDAEADALADVIESVGDVDAAPFEEDGEVIDAEASPSPEDEDLAEQAMAQEDEAEAEDEP